MRFWNKMADTRKNKEIAQAKTEALQTQRTALQGDLEKLQTDRGKEEFFREDLGQARVGEEVIVIVDNLAEAEEPKQSHISGFFSFFVNLFK